MIKSGIVDSVSNGAGRMAVSSSVDRMGVGVNKGLGGGRKLNLGKIHT